ncbi:MAG: hypothetical protein QG670_894 [Thermoproteota archaeon]|nr:hypothetical protein [Thermoproteota archaeon]
MDNNYDPSNCRNQVLSRVLNLVSDIQGQVLIGDFLGAFISTRNLFQFLPPDVRLESKIKAYEKTMEKVQLTVKGLNVFYNDRKRSQILIDWTSINIKTILEGVNDILYEKCLQVDLS